MIIGLGDPVTDILHRASRHEIITLLRDDEDKDACVTGGGGATAVEIGGCVPVDARRLERILDAIDGESGEKRRTRVTPGGSAANVLKCIAKIRECKVDDDDEDADADDACAFVGGVDGSDDVGIAYERALRNAGVKPALIWHKNSGAKTVGSARCLCLVDEHGQRTMRTYLGASAQTRAEDLPEDVLKKAKVLHMEGYALYKPDVVRRACAIAKENGAMVSIDLASFEVVRNCRDALDEALKSEWIDVVFCNEDEARELVAVSDNAVGNNNGRSAPRPSEEMENEALEYLLRFVKVATCSRGKRGCVSMNREGEKATSRAEGVDAIDTTGAGDTFTGAFLHALLRGGTLQQCGDAGCAAAAQVVQVRGAEMDESRWEIIRDKLSRLVG
jgi:sugar/nucleoside kinase (ribokinase family)